MSSPKSPDTQPRTWIARAFTIVEDVVYLGLGVLLAGIVLTLLVTGFISFGKSLMDESLGERVVKLLDRILLILLIVELLYTVQVSFREHALVPEPFILVALIATVRRILVITAEFGAQGHPGDDVIRYVLSELGLLTVLVIVLVASLGFLHLRVGTSPAIRRDG